MGNIFAVFKRDMKNIATNWVALIVVIALSILPALYAWFNIKAMWDPYGNTSGILVAVVNEDKGAHIGKTDINIGSELVNKLKENRQIGWRFVNKKDADKGIKYGDYYAEILIPNDFSTDITSLLKSNPKRASLIYSVNEKLNPVAPKITEGGVSKVQQEINSTFVKIVDGIIFKLFNTLGDELSKGKPFLQQFADMIIDVDNKIPEINKAVDSVYSQTEGLNNFIASVKGQIPLMQNTLDNASEIAENSSQFLSKAKTTLNELSPFIKSELVFLDETAKGSEDFVNNIISLIDKNPKEARNLLSSLRNRLSDSRMKLDTIIDLVNSFNKIDNKAVSDFSEQLSSLKERIQSETSYTNSLIDSIDKGENISRKSLENLSQNASLTTKILDSIIKIYDTYTAPSINSIMQNSINAANDSLELLKSIENSMPAAQDVLDNASGDTQIAMDSIKNIKTALPKVESTIHSIASKLKSLDNDAQINELIRLLGLNAQKESNFIANPVNIKVNKVYHVPNYGSAMNPFFTTLSLWVGGLILVSLLSTEVLPIHGVKLKLHQAFLGRYITFLSISILQAIIVTIGNLFMLHTYASNPIAFILVSIFTSTVFTMIIYTFVSAFENIGKAISMILLVLQISASGGTFPIQVTPLFFQIINPLLPFTYAIGAMRETVGGILYPVFIKDIAILSVYFAVFLLAGIFLKRIFRKLISKFSEKFGESGLEG